MRDFKKNPSNLALYDSVIREQLRVGFIEKVENPSISTPKMHYLPHRAVYNDSKTTPLRVVFDCSAKGNKHSPSLNECLESGPSLNKDFCHILLRFRTKKFACMADIAKAYLQCSLSEADRDSTRFLWPENPLDPSSPLMTLRFKVVLFGPKFYKMLFQMCIANYRIFQNGSPNIYYSFGI